MSEEESFDRIPIDWQKADELMMAGCLGTEIAAYFGMHPETFYDRVVKKYKVGFSEYFAKLKGKGASLLRAQQYAKALGLTDKGDNTLLIWLGKNRLGQKDKEDENDKLPPRDEIIEKEKQIAIMQYKLDQLSKGSDADKL